MNMKRLLTLVAFFATVQASAQQVNPVPDYVFRNQMSVGRNAVTDTAAYFSIGPRYGATKGFMPPIVGDTATFSSGKRNGLLIFSVQKNKFLYWDSVRVQWSDMAGGSGSYILAGDTAAMLAPYLRKADTTAMLSPYLRKADTATLSNRINLKLNISDTSSMLTPYVRHAGYGLTKSGQSFLVDTLNIATRAWRQKGLDSLAALEVSGSGTTNYVPKFTASSTIGNSQIFDNGTNVGIGTTSPTYKFHTLTSDATIAAFRNSGAANGQILIGNTAGDLSIRTLSTGDSYIFSDIGKYLDFGSNGSFRLRIFSNGRIGVNTTTDAGYQFDVNGTLRTVNGANFATTSGNVGIGTASPSGKLDVTDALVSDYASIVRLRNSNAGTTNTNLAIEFWDRSTSINGAVIGTRSNIAGNWGGDIIFKNQQNGSPQTTTTSLTEVMKLDGANQRISLSPAGTELFRFASTGELLINTTTDAGDYKLQVVGNARVGTGKLDIASNTTFGLGVARSGTSEIAGQIYNSNGILYFGAESSAGGQIFTGSSAYAAVIGSGANYPLQFATNNATRATINTNGELLVNTTNDQGDYKLQINGSVYNTGQVTRGVINVQGTGAQVFVDSTTNLSPFSAIQSLSGSNISPLFSGNATWNTTGNVNGIDLYVTNTASGANSNYMQLSDGTNIFKVTKDAGIITANPSSGTAAKWKLGSRQAGEVELDTTQFIEVEIGGTFYRLAIVTPL